MKKGNPAISIIVPCYNGKRTLQACVDSLLSLSPDSPSHEIIVVDNGSDDGSYEILKQISGLKVLLEKEMRGPSAARNKGAIEASGDFLAFTDIDCVVSRNWLVSGVSGFSSQDITGVGGAIEGVKPKNRIQDWMNSRKILDQERALANPFMPYLQTANAFFRRDAFLAVNGFDRSLYCGEDCDLSWRILKKCGGKLAYKPEAVVFHDHRCSIRGLFRQSMKNAMGGAALARKWGAAIPKKSWKLSVWECWGVVRAFLRFFIASATRSDRSIAAELRLDLIHRTGRKLGQIKSAIQNRQWNQW